MRYDNIRFTMDSTKKCARAPVSFGTPWTKGTLMPGESVSLQDEIGKRIPIQTKINAYWPDGSVKWLLHSGVLDTRKTFSIEPGEGARMKQCVTAFQAAYPLDIVRSDYPDPSIVRVGNNYYMIHSPFMYAPGLLIWHSRNLTDWVPLCHAIQSYIGDFIGLRLGIYAAGNGEAEFFDFQYVAIKD